MRTVRFDVKEIGDHEFVGEVKVLGYRAIDYGTSPEEVRQKLIEHLIEEDEIREGNYQVETSTE